jgi:hypothetical protein
VVEFFIFNNSIFMSIFLSDSSAYFNQANWENTPASPVSSKKSRGSKKFESAETSDKDSNQFILLQLSDGDKRVLNTSEVEPALTGTEEKPDINMLLDFDSFKIGSNEDVDPKAKATLQLKIGQEKQMDKLDKLFYCINGGLDLYDELKNKKADAKDFRKSTAGALGNKPISLPGGLGEISLQVVQHLEPKWWQRIFTFAKTDKGKELLSLIGFGGITESAVSCIGGMLDNLFTKPPEVLFQSQPVKLGFSKAAKQELGGGLSTNYVSCLNPGFWVMARLADYKTIIDSKPIYYGGLGLLAPDGMDQIEANSGNNPFSKITYAVIRAKMKEVDLKQGVI